LAEVGHTPQVLMKWQANAHLYRGVTNGEMAGAAGTAVAAVYSLIACVNHSCAPNCDVVGPTTCYSC
jgi:hypothetical protein